MAWSQENGTDRLTPTADLVASPPMAQIKPGAVQLVRVVRMSKAERTREESFRILVDEIPVAKHVGTNGVRLTVRHVLPAFFAGKDHAQRDILWSIEKVNGAWHCIARNPGQRRVRIARLRITDAQGRSVSLGEGLVGYVLAGSVMQWPVPLQTFNLGNGVEITAQTESGLVRVAVGVPGRR